MKKTPKRATQKARGQARGSGRSAGSGVVIGMALLVSLIGVGWLWQASTAEPVAVRLSQAQQEPQTRQEPAQTRAPAIAQTKPVEVVPQAKASPDMLPSTPKVWDAANFAASLEGTQIDGRLRADANGDLIVGLEVKDFFDYFLSTVGEVPAEEAISQIRALASEHLPSSAADQAVAILEHYLEYKQRAFEHGQQPLVTPAEQSPAYQLQQLREAQAALKQIRRDTLPREVAEAFFGLEEAYGDFTLAAIEIQQRDDLSAEQKRAMTDYERSRLPEVLRKSHKRVSNSASRAGDVEEVIRTAKSADDARARLQAMGLSDDHVQEIVSVVQSQTHFEDRYSDYRKERQALEDAGLADTAREQAEEKLRDRYFDNEQQKTWARLRDLGSEPSDS